MDLTRRNFLKFTAATGTVGVVGASQKVKASTHHKPISPDWKGVLLDTTACIGCRRCEWACKDHNKLPNPPIETYEDRNIFKKMRRPDVHGYTVVNRYENPDALKKHTYVKVQCMQCNEAACVSACIVSALTKDEKTGAVKYDPGKCIGCRYCMAACPFQIPAYDYHNALTPKVQKSSFCLERINKYGGKPACVEICPVEAMIFGKRSELLKIAHDRIRKYPDRYYDHVYGEHELGGTGWLYLSSKPMWEMDMIKFDDRPIPSYTERIQHSLFKNFVPPVALFGVLAGLMRIFKKEEEHALTGEGGDK